MMISPENLFDTAASKLDTELFEQLAGNAKVRIERIVSLGHVTPAGAWYDQLQHEWVAVLQGEARLEFASGEQYLLVAGSHLLIPPHVRHRVAWTKPDIPTIWLAVHY